MNSLQPTDLLDDKFIDTIATEPAEVAMAAVNARKVGALHSGWITQREDEVGTMGLWFATLFRTTRDGVTLWRIAFRHHANVEAAMVSNSITNEDDALAFIDKMGAML